MKKKKKNYYISNEGLLEELISYKKSMNMSEELGTMFLELATNYASKGSFAGYTWREDMVADAVYTCIRYAHKFNPNMQKKPNPFAYFTTICHRAFINYINKQKKHGKIKDICYRHVDVVTESTNRFSFSDKAIDYQVLKSYK